MEVLLGLVVIVIALYGVLDLLAANQKLSVRAHRRAVAVELAQAKMAEIQAAGYGAVEALWAKSPGGAGQPFACPPKLTAFAAPYEAKPFSWQAQFVRDAQNPDVIQVEVRVAWDLIESAPDEKTPVNSVAVGTMLVKK